MLAPTRVRISSLLCAAALVASCAKVVPIEDRAVVLTVTEAPDWAAAGATVEVRDPQNKVLLVSALEAGPPILLDVKAPLSVHELTVSLRLEDYEAEGEAEIKQGYASCKVH